MSDDTEATGTADELRAQLHAVMARPLITPALRRRKLLLWAFRQVLLGLLAWRFWDHAWMRWVFGIGVVFAIVNLFMILFAQRLLDARARRTAQRIDALERTLRAPDAHNDGDDRALSRS
jgi:hypothetical protein